MELRLKQLLGPVAGHPTAARRRVDVREPGLPAIAHRARRVGVGVAGRPTPAHPVAEVGGCDAQLLAGLRGGPPALSSDDHAHTPRIPHPRPVADRLTGWLTGDARAMVRARSGNSPYDQA